MTTKCIKLAIDYIKDNKLDKNIFFKELRDIQYKTYLACNRAMTYYYTHDMQNMIAKENNEVVKKDEEIYGKTFKSYVYNKISEILGNDVTSYVANCIIQFVSNRYKNDKKQGLFKGNVTLSEFKRDIPVMLRDSSYKIIETPKGLGIEIQFFRQNKLKEMGMKSGERIKFLFPRIDNSSKATLINIMSKTYKQGSIQLSYNQRKKKWMATISYTFENKKEEELKEERILGIDLGITNVATMSVYDNDKEEYVQINWKERSISGKELIHYRQKLENRRKELSIATKWSSENRCGRGYKNKMINVNKVGDKYSRFKDTYNHKVSRYIVDLAVKYQCATIQMENLSGFSEQQAESLLKNWSYYDLQNKVKYKAEEKGIKVTFINPKYTSKRCSKCGCIHIDNRDCKNNQAEFECRICGHKENADINASKNIAIKDIDMIIKNTEVLTN